MAGNIVRMTNAQGVVTGSFEYNAWGEKLLDQPPPEGTRFGFSAPAWMTLKDDPDQRFIITPTRIYDTATGRFMQRDKLRLSGRYSYAWDNPLSYYDPNGAEPTPGPAASQHQSIPDQCRAAGLTPDECDIIFPRRAQEWAATLAEVNAFIEGMSEGIQCWLNCEMTIHKCVEGKILTVTEIVTGTMSIPGIRIPKARVVNPDDPYTSVARALANKLSTGKWEGTAGERTALQNLGRALGRSRWVAAAKGVFVAAAWVEAGVSIYCGVTCSSGRSSYG